MKIRGIILLLAVIYVFTGCFKHKPVFTNRAFYYWKTVMNISTDDAALLKKLKINRMYLRLYDVVYDDAVKMAVPVSPVTFGEKLPMEIGIVPVIFISQEVMKLTQAGETRVLAKNMMRLAASVLKRGKIEPEEFQLDYDWTPSTRERYFEFIGEFKKELNKVYPGTGLSVTIRLHQVKYRSASGVPNVAKGMLMAYNLNDIRFYTPNNAVYTSQELGKYADSMDNYPVKLDLALPVYPSYLVYKNGLIKNILTSLDKKTLNDPEKFKKSGIGGYTALKNFLYNGVQFSIGDVVKIERANITALKKGVQLAGKKRNAGDTLCLFHFDTQLIEEATGEKADSLRHVFER